MLNPVIEIRDPFIEAFYALASIRLSRGSETALAGGPSVDSHKSAGAPSFRSFIAEGWDTTDFNLPFPVPA
jgi:hypothetical protein